MSDCANKYIKVPLTPLCCPYISWLPGAALLLVGNSGGREDSVAGGGGREAEERERLRRLEADHMEGIWLPCSAGSGLGLVGSEETAKDIAEEDMVRTLGLGSMKGILARREQSGVRKVPP